MNLQLLETELNMRYKDTDQGLWTYEGAMTDCRLFTIFTRREYLPNI